MHDEMMNPTEVARECNNLAERTQQHGMLAIYSNRRVYSESTVNREPLTAKEECKGTKGRAPYIQHKVGGARVASLDKVPRLFDCPSPCSVPSNSSHSSYTSASSGDTFRRISMNSYGSSLTDNTESTFEMDSRRSSAWSTLRNAVLEVGGSARKAPIDITIDGTNGTPQKKVSSISRGKLRRIATQVTRAIRRKRRESLAIRRESRATRVVAAILIAFLICWIPYFCVSVIRGIAMGFAMNINTQLHLQLYLMTSWLGYAHSCFNPVIYMCLNKNFRSTMRRLVRRPRKGE
ncbi:unnamed protein product [Nippostrongylus brasiliensis]|uniref:G_PROTEIN_RECEP_F1_2 domain-containing protein n=1 Tax=Nippostrongylus brasiliensis TaxID=27835 RepID=A0A158R331_NIPBR|nr:unnamed protein product [Nippostrongylus brasiliensis]